VASACSTCSIGAPTEKMPAADSYELVGKGPTSLGGLGPLVLGATRSSKFASVILTDQTVCAGGGDATCVDPPCCPAVGKLGAEDTGPTTLPVPWTVSDGPRAWTPGMAV